MMQSELICDIYRYLSVKGVGPAKANKLFISASNKKEQIDEQYLKASLTAEQQSQFDMLLDFTIPHTVAGQEVGYMHILSSDYPERLAMDLSANAPTVISYIGNLSLLRSRCIVFSGSRKVWLVMLLAWTEQHCIQHWSLEYHLLWFYLKESVILLLGRNYAMSGTGIRFWW